MNSFSVAIIKTLLISVGTLTIILSVFLMSLMFNIAIQNGIPALENIKFTIALFFAILMLLVICFCLKIFLSITIDSRDFQLNKNRINGKTRVDDVTL
ncbi:hypothetical protein C9415_09140 [Kluyvera sp. Nf5]|nr:hypothetical protein C9415_09140 [Kluyvera sp. Nf5]